jgi:ectoine hydroxylase-related dioxygenase (phytanoyl-CoA dioxygenase family)
MNASAIDTERFAHDGYLVVRDLVPRAVVDDVRDLLETHVEDATTALAEKLGAADRDDLFAMLARLESDGTAAALDRQTMNVAHGLFPLEIRMSARLRAVAYAEPVRAAVAELLGSDALGMHMPPTARHIARGNAASPVPAHQDVSYNAHMTDFLTMWTPFTSIDADCSGVGIYRGTNEPRERAAAHDGFWLGAIATDEATLVHTHMEPGDVLFLSKWIVHRSMPNRSARTRVSCDYRFFAAPATSSKHWLELATGIIHEPKGAS